MSQISNVTSCSEISWCDVLLISCGYLPPLIESVRTKESVHLHMHLYIRGRTEAVQGTVRHPANPLISTMGAQDLDQTNQTGLMARSLPTKTG